MNIIWLMDINPLEAMIWYIAFLFSVTLHEAAHAWTAMKGGDLTAYHAGQVSLDPLPHIKREPLGMVLLPIVFLLSSGWPFGFAHAPYNAAWALRYPKKAAMMALAGPASNLCLVLVSALLIHLGIAAGVFKVPSSISSDFTNVVEAVGHGFWSHMAMTVSIFFSLNIILALLNMIPLPPLDGRAILSFFLGHEANLRYQRIISQPMIAMAGLFAAWMFFGKIFWPLFVVSVNLLYPGSNFR